MDMSDMYHVPKSSQLSDAVDIHFDEEDIEKDIVIIDNSSSMKTSSI